MDTDEPIKALYVVRAAHARIAEAESAQRAAIEAARQAGVQWRLIAAAVGMPQQSASRKFGPLARPQGKADPATAVEAVARIEVLHQAVLDAQLAEVMAIAAARAAGVTWQAIADEVGMAQPNAVVKYRPLVEAGREGAAVLLRSRWARAPRGGDGVGG